MIRLEAFLVDKMLELSFLALVYLLIINSGLPPTETLV